ncbi:MAG TPA: hemolysin family protein [Thermoanaerobaculia bacterium]|nr:hemolysin family protein [Thermoanaerobaculia bacterium]
MTAFPFGAGVATVFACLFAALYVILSAFAQALESLSAVRRKALLEGSPERFGKLLAPEIVQVSRIAVRLTAQGAVLGGLLSLGTGLAALNAPEPWLISALAILAGWIVLETFVIRWVGRRGADALLTSFSWLIPLVHLLAAPLTPVLSRLVERPEEPEDAAGGAPAAAENPSKDAEVRALLDVAREEGILEEHEEELVSRAVDFSDRTVHEVMTPRQDVTIAEADAPLESVADIFISTKYTRIPLVQGGIEKPVGVVHIKDVFTALRSGSPPANARPLARPVLFVPESQTITTLLSDFRRRRQHLAVVVDEYGTVTGVVTLEDLVEELVGDIADEHEDALDAVVPLTGGGYSVSGRVRLTELESLLSVSFSGTQSDTVAGFLSERLGRIPRPGEKVAEAGLVFAVEDSDRRRIHRVKVTRAEVPVEVKA